MFKKVSSFVHQSKLINDISLSKLLVWLAGLLWLISLFLPGFNGTPGVWIALLGLTFGWLAFEWAAAYANIFFIIGFFQLRRLRMPIISIMLMLILSSTVQYYPTSIDVPSKEGPPLVDSWGWGFFVWLSAQVILALALLVSVARWFLVGFGITKSVMAEVKIIGAVFSLLVLGGLGSIGMHVNKIGKKQYQKANAQDQKRYFPWGTAVVVADLCKIPLQITEGPVLPFGALFETDFEEGELGAPKIRFEKKFG
jgi:hypothetical protein